MLNTGRKPGQLREYEKKARDRAFEGARLAISENLSLETAAERVGSKRSTVQDVILIMRHGTPEEVSGVENGHLQVRAILDLIRSRTSVEERKAAARPAVRTERVQADTEFDAQVWSRFRTSLDILTGLPNPDDVIAIIKKHPQRTETTSRKVLTAHTWLEEFVNAWTK